nr:hypothetical protein [Kibdelosporangium sp. MJ126-NF4]CEL17593.1 hypothetical protein [Kibdelosporangium sp. MJ126-NF4]
MADPAVRPDGCPACLGEGVLRWTQPTLDGTQGWILRKMAMPCPLGCGDTWKHPAAEADRVINPPDDRPERIRGQVDAMEAADRATGYDAFMQKALAQAGYTSDQHGLRES